MDTELLMLKMKVHKLLDEMLYSGVEELQLMAAKIILEINGYKIIQH